MPYPWPGISTQGGTLSEQRQHELRALIDELADEVERHLTSLEFHRNASPIFAPSNLIVVEDANQVLVVATKLAGGVAEMRWMDQRGRRVAMPALVQEVERKLAQPMSFSAMLPKPESVHKRAELTALARQHVADVERLMRLARLGDISGLGHLENALREFLNDHPDPRKNVFIMMRFLDTDRHRQIHQSLKDAFATHGYKALRSDDREYTDELWTNIEVYLTGCHLGVAVYEQIEDRNFNPNVSLELGYMTAKRRRFLILKEKHMETLHADVIYRLYKPFDMFDIEKSIKAQIDRWVKDLPSS
jgi:hypothetical protein